MSGISDQLYTYGPLGLFVLVLLYAVVALWRARNADTLAHTLAIETLRKEYQSEISSLIKAHKGEMDVLVQRHIGKAETWVEKGLELSNNLQRTLDSLSRRRGGDD